ncbi:MAG: hypothetical protein KC503_47335 [Myxococcales bacterium]|nr:hypothetical protein [Myxococcales bacterium]
MKRLRTLHRISWPSALAIIAVGCTGYVNEPSTQVASLHYIADVEQMGGLVAQTCRKLHPNDPATCEAVPNVMECETLDITIRADAKMNYTCKQGAKIVYQGPNAGLASPIECRANKDLSCVLCYDNRGTVAVDTCNDRGAQLFRKTGSGAWGEAPQTIPGVSVPNGPTPDNPGTTPGNPSTPPQNPGTTPQTPTAPPLDLCDPRNAVIKYFAPNGGFNQELAREGLGFRHPGVNAANLPDFNSGFFGGQGSCAEGPSHIKQYAWGNKNCTTSNVGGGGGFWGSLLGLIGGGANGTCRGYRVAMQPAMRACQEGVPAGCNPGAWTAAINYSYRTASQWLFSFAPGAVPPDSIPPNTPPPTNPPTQTPPLTPPTGFKPPVPKMLGSPLVLDLAGDGIAATSAANGTKFDLMGLGKMKTAWVKGDDALLAMDRNGNGRIDNGSELFGDVTKVDGVEAGDGFAALAALDTNKNGRIDAGDAAFKQLKLWRDKNGDGISQASELTSLAAEGIKSLELKHQSGSDFDLNGNDLGVRGSFIRNDGRRGTMVDIYFVTGGFAK